jgi:archaellum component FlaC
MKKVMVGLLVMMLLVPLVIAAVGCSSESTEDKEKKLCQDLADLDTALKSVLDISMDSSLDDLEANVKKVEDAWNNVVSSAKEVSSAQIDDLKKAIEDLLKTFDNFSSDTSISEALEALGANITAVENAWKQLTTSLNCDELLK